MSFQAIFSIILIIIFIVAAGFVVRVLLRNVEYSRLINFRQELSSEVEKMWQTTSSEKTLTLSLPSKITFLCFTENLDDLDETHFPSSDVYAALYDYSLEDANIFFYNPDILEGHNINPFLRILCGTAKKSCFSLEDVEDICCIKNKNSITMTLKKDIGESDVKLVPKNCV